MSTAEIDTKFLRYIHPGLEIPSQYKNALLPSTSLSVLQFIKFPLPGTALECTEDDPTDFFSKTQPSTYDAGFISAVATPNPDMLAMLRDTCRVSESSGYQSVYCPSIAEGRIERLPLWVITYWTEVHNLRPIQQSWSKGEARSGGVSGQKVVLHWWTKPIARYQPCRGMARFKVSQIPRTSLTSTDT